MKTNVHISDGLLADAQELARREKTTLKALIEEGLSRVVAQRKSRAPFQLRQASFQGPGLQLEFADAPWESIRAAIYDDAR
jgi:Bacterial antitoxin of type II TA system, VapB